DYANIVSVLCRLRCVSAPNIDISCQPKLGAFMSWNSNKLTRYNSQEDVRIHQTQTRYQGFMALDAVELQFRRFAGDWSPIMERELLRRQEAAGVLIWDPKRDELLFIEQFRIGALEDERSPRSEEHTSELQSRFDLVCRLLLEKKKMNIS